jgi:hypothetical protein
MVASSCFLIPELGKDQMQSSGKYNGQYFRRFPKITDPEALQGILARPLSRFESTHAVTSDEWVPLVSALRPDLCWLPVPSFYQQALLLFLHCGFVGAGAAAAAATAFAAVRSFAVLNPVGRSPFLGAELGAF